VTGRKPIGTSYEDWVERQIREATDRGDFDNLPGAGAPLHGLDRDFSAEQWAADKARSEGFDVTAMLPPALALRRERETIVRDVAQLPSSVAVRELVTDFNNRVREHYRRPADGPFVVVALLEEEPLVQAWERAWERARPAAPTAAVVTVRRRGFLARLRGWRHTG